MYLFKRPSADSISRFIASQSQLEFSYPSIGATRDGDHPPGYTLDHERIHLGVGESTFNAAKRALRQWQHYRFDWIELHRPDREPESNQVVGVLARGPGFWVLNACRVVYVVEEQRPVCRYGFAYGTLPEHVESGEERFQIEWREDDSVWYDILAFSRHNQLISRIAYPYVRRKQKQFARDSMRAMKTAVNRCAGA